MCKALNSFAWVILLLAGLLAAQETSKCILTEDGRCKTDYRKHPALYLNSWYHSGGSFLLTGAGNWIENDGGLVEIPFAEASRDFGKKQVVLYDAGRQVTINLFAGSSTLQFSGSTSSLFNGDWVALTLQASDAETYSSPDMGDSWRHHVSGAIVDVLALDKEESSAENLILKSATRTVRLSEDGSVDEFGSNGEWNTIQSGHWRPPDRQDLPTLRHTKPHIHKPPRNSKSTFDIALVTLSTPNIAHYALEAEKNQLHYATKHGYKFYVYRNSLVEWDEQRGAWHSIVTWNKIRAAMDLLPKHEWVVWVDSDAIFVDLEKKLEEIIALAPKKEFLVCKDPKQWLLNTGVMFFRNTKWTRDMLDKLWNMPKVQHSSGAEQNQLIKLLQHIDANQGHWHLFPECTFNCHPSNAKADTYLIHYMGMGGAQKERSIKEWNKKLHVV
eukprot:c104_g1_i1.p1 GENE.c104_g1_i1~~c104_g1_i1.p1  ORF type:complete len:449 (-),score=86.91 c104_g1_i1:204-1529(-)